jgi:hypothetical protein
MHERAGKVQLSDDPPANDRIRSDGFHADGSGEPVITGARGKRTHEPAARISSIAKYSGLKRISIASFHPSTTSNP